jgi:Ca2+-binding EF-hand superfamily protein
MRSSPPSSSSSRLEANANINQAIDSGNNLNSDVSANAAELSRRRRLHSADSRGEKPFVIDVPDDVIDGDDDDIGEYGEGRAVQGDPGALRGDNNYNYFPYDIHERQDGQDTGVNSGCGDGYIVSPRAADGFEQTAEPSAHLELLANQILRTLRDMILERHRGGYHLLGIFRHFDRNEKSYFDVKDLVRGLADLRIETTEKVAGLMIDQLAIDSKEKVSFGEFRVFVTDEAHKLLEEEVQVQMARRLDRFGRSFQSTFHSMLVNSDSSSPHTNNSGQENHHQSAESMYGGFLSAEAFVSTLTQLGLHLTSVDFDRLITRFDIDGRGLCSVPRFTRMITESISWRQSLQMIVYQEEAIKEAAAARHNRTASSSSQQQQRVPDAVIDMAEYLGIRVLSEPHLLWIAEDAVHAPLPINWSVQKDGKGRTFFYNHLTNQSQWGHPLDPHFRQLRDHHRRAFEESFRTADGININSDNSYDDNAHSSLRNDNFHPLERGAAHEERHRAADISRSLNPPIKLAFRSVPSVEDYSYARTNIIAVASSSGDNRLSSTVQTHVPQQTELFGQGIVDRSWSSAANGVQPEVESRHVQSCKDEHDYSDLFDTAPPATADPLSMKPKARPESQSQRQLKLPVEVEVTPREIQNMYESMQKSRLLRPVSAPQHRRSSSAPRQSCPKASLPTDRQRLLNDNNISAPVAVRAQTPDPVGRRHPRHERPDMYIPTGHSAAVTVGYSAEKSAAQKLSPEEIYGVSLTKKSTSTVAVAGTGLMVGLGSNGIGIGQSHARAMNRPKSSVAALRSQTQAAQSQTNIALAVAYNNGNNLGSPYQYNDNSSSYDTTASSRNALVLDMFHVTSITNTNTANATER